MASITPNRKNGKITSYKFKACVGRDEFGKQIFRCTTWKVPDGMVPSQAEKAATKAALEWEKHARDEYQKDLQNPERVKERLTATSRTDMAEFIQTTWFPICICDGEHKPTTVALNKHISAYFSGKAIQTLTVGNEPLFRCHNSGSKVRRKNNDLRLCQSVHGGSEHERQQP